MARGQLVLVAHLGLTALLGLPLAAVETPVAVTPGAGSEVAVIGDRCPTFGWAGGAAGDDLELVVYQLAEDGAPARAVLYQRLPGSARSWTPPLDRCLERGRRYAWAIRALADEGAPDRAAVSRFEVGELGLDEALATVERYLALRRAVNAAPRGSDHAELAPTPAASTPSPAAPAASTVTGTHALEAWGDTCCDGRTPDAYPVRLGNRSTGNDPDVLALWLANQRNPAENMNYIGFFDQSGGQSRLVGEIEGDNFGGLRFSGSAGVSGLYTATSPEIVCTSAAPCVGSASCLEPYTMVLGGGVEFIAGSGDVQFIESFPQVYGPSSTWEVELRASGSASFRFEVVALCGDAVL